MEKFNRVHVFPLHLHHTIPHVDSLLNMELLSALVLLVSWRIAAQRGSGFFILFIFLADVETQTASLQCQLLILNTREWMGVWGYTWNGNSYNRESFLFWAKVSMNQLQAVNVSIIQWQMAVLIQTNWYVNKSDDNPYWSQGVLTTSFTFASDY